MMRGEVWMVDLPISSGREQSGQRPAVVIQNESYGVGSPLVLIVLFTSQLAALRFPGAILVEPSESNGLSAPSVAMVFQTRALDRSRFRRRVGVLTDENMNHITTELGLLTSASVP